MSLTLPRKCAALSRDAFINEWRFVASSARGAYLATSTFRRGTYGVGENARPRKGAACSMRSGENTFPPNPLLVLWLRHNTLRTISSFEVVG